MVGYKNPFDYLSKFIIPDNQLKKIPFDDAAYPPFHDNVSVHIPIIDSSGFKKETGHQNPAAMPYRSLNYTAGQVTLGEFELSDSLVGKINYFTPLPVDDEDSIPPAYEDQALLHDGGIYLGLDPASPQIGDVRVSFKIVEPTEVSVVAQQYGHRLVSYRAETGGTIELLRKGFHTADAMFKAAHQSNKMLTWILRIAGLVVMMIGLNLFLKPLSVLADVLPIFGNIVGAGTFLISLLAASGLSFVTAAVAWLFYRPLLGVSLLVLAGGLAIFLFAKLRKPKPVAPKTVVPEQKRVARIATGVRNTDVTGAAS